MCSSDLAVKINNLKYADLKTLSDIKDPVPLEIFISILKNQNSDCDPEVCFEEDGYLYSGILNSISLKETMFGTRVVGYINIISKSSENYVIGEKTVNLPYVSFVKSVNDLGLKEIDDNMRNELTERGRKYINVTKKPHYCSYKGYVLSEGFMGDVRDSVNSRVMIDINAMRLLNPRTSDYWYEGEVFNSDDVVGENVPENMLWMTSPAVYGFAFGNKLWCKMNIDNISEIEFSKNAFDELIIPQANKNIFIASLTHTMPSLDSIEDKGEGKIFLLYGAPGVGK